MKVLLADDKQEVRSALNLLLEHDPGIWAVEGEACNFAEILELMASTYFDVILLDWELPGFRVDKCANGFNCSKEQLERLQSIQSDIKIIAMSGRPEARSEALSVGVNAFISKGDPPEALLETLKSHSSNTISR